MEERIRSGESVSEVIVRAVSEVESCPPADLPPLYEAVEPDALDALCAEQPTGERRSSCTISFDYSDSHVVVEGCASVTVSRRSEAEPSEHAE